jgi:argininosuccinate lyase
VGKSLEIAGEIVSHTKFNTKDISARLKGGFLDATALAEYLVQKGAAFRDSHGIVGSLVAYCEKEGKVLGDLGLEELQKFSAVIEGDVYERLGAGNVARGYATEGAAGPKQAKEQVEYWNKQLGQR